MAIESLHDALVDELRDLLSAEKQLVRAIPKLAKNAESAALQEALTAHLEETQQQAERLKQCLETLDANVRAKTCEAMKGLVEEGSELAAEKAPGPINDALIIAAARKVEHYEIASYETVIAWARELGASDVAELLEATLSEEEAADAKLTKLSEKIHAAAMSAVEA